MKIAACYQKSDGTIFQHFGHTEFFKVYEIEGGEVVSGEVVDSGSGGEGHESLAGFLKKLDVSALICGGIGGGAVEALNATGIEIYGGNTALADDAAKLLAEGKLVKNSNANCRHHDGEHHHEHNHGEGGNHGASGATDGIVFRKI